MPDAFFVSKKSRKRKRSSGSKSKEAFGSQQVNGKGRPNVNEKNKLTSRKRKDEELDSEGTQSGIGDDDLDLQLRRQQQGDASGTSGEEDELETPGQKRLRLAKEYLDGLREELVDGEVDAAELDREIIASRLRQDVMEHSGKMYKFIADSLVIPDSPVYLRTRGHREAVTAAVTSQNPTPSSSSNGGKHQHQYLFTAGKEGNIVCTDLVTGKHVSTFYKLRQRAPSSLSSTGVGGKGGKGKQKALGTGAGAAVRGHTDEVLALALSDDGKVLASGGKDRKLIVWDAESGEWVRSFSAHKDAISALSFRKGTKTLYTASLDRSLKIFDLSPTVMGYVDTHFGHQDHVVSLDALRNETAVTVGARDRTLRFWKVVENAQLVLRGGGKSRVREVLEGGLDVEGGEEGGDGDESGGVKKKGKEKGRETEKRYEEGSLDCVCMVDESTFVTGGDSGSISIWTPTKKKPIYTQPLAHGLHTTYSETEGVITTPRWITALGCVRYGDVLASGSWEGEVRLWRIGSGSGSDVNPGFNVNVESEKNRNERIWNERSRNDKGKTRTMSLTLTLIGALPAPGIVNSLQVLLLPKATTDSWQWLTAKKVQAREMSSSSSHPEADSSRQNGQVNGDVSANANTVKGKHEKDLQSVVAIAGLGREPRLGRWMTLKGDGAVNGSRVFVLDVRP